VSVELVILADSAAPSGQLQPDKGLSIYVSGPDRKMLFDTGPDGPALLDNARLQGLDLRLIQGVILSHGHRGHTGGLAEVASCRPGLGLYAHPGAFERRWVDRAGESLRELTCPHSLTKLQEMGAFFHPVKAPEMLAGWLLLSGPIGGPMAGREVFVVRKGDDMVVDTFEDELFMLLRDQQGWVLVTGCCHRGLKNTLRTGRFLAHGRRIAAIVGGLHLAAAETGELQAAVEILRSYDSPDLYPGHCTGTQAVGYLAEQFPHKVHPLSAGMRIIF
jgi:7,8-dihydropterin-6-yl-methyl-4-(beta-D-ribofuranosyl)aminobenzene 5'-phosphate synthase